MFDVIIIGAGLTGMTMACSLAKKNVNVAVVEYADIDKILAKESDGRTCAISQGSAEIFANIGLWDAMKPDACEILDINITDGDCPSLLHYDHKMVGDDPMGYIVENYHIRQALFKKAAEFDNLEIFSPFSFKDIKNDANKVSVTLSNDEVLEARLLIAADGRNSKTCEKFGIEATILNYKQQAIVFTASHEKHHQNIAWEKFLPAGPFAILPMQGGYKSSIVWTEDEKTAPLFMKMNDEEFLEQFSSRFGDHLGKLDIVGKRFCYPLTLSHAKRYTDQRLAVIGDAAHGMHPIAGQGFNLGIRDVDELSKLIIDTQNLGLDIGANSLLKQYENLRKLDNVSLLGITDILNRLFSNNITILKVARQLGITAIEQLPSIKKFFIKHAMGKA